MSIPDFDLIIIGAGITGAGLFRMAARAGLKVFLLEKSSAGTQTTGSSSGLIHGGLRYLPYDVGTSMLCCREAGALKRLYPDLLKRQVFLWPVYRGDRYPIGFVEALLEYYDCFAPWKQGLAHVRLSASETLEIEPGLQPGGLVGAITFDEWAVDAVALVRRLLQDGQRYGGVLQEGCRVTGFTQESGVIRSVRYLDTTGADAEATSRIVVNATGPWAEQVAGLAGCKSVRLVLRKGVHLIVEKSPARYGLIFQDLTGRMIGLYPRGASAWAGPTDDPFDQGPDDKPGTQQEFGMLQKSVHRILPKAATDSCTTVAGLRPIIRQYWPGPLSRDYRIYDHSQEGVSNLITVTGGKLTAFEPMAAETLKLAFEKIGMPWPAALIPTFARSLMEKLLVKRGRLFTLLASLILLSYHAMRHFMLSFTSHKRRGLDIFQRTYQP